MNANQSNERNSQSIARASRGATTGGITLISASGLALFLILHHPIPHAHSFDEFISEVDSMKVINAIVHGGMMGIVGLFVFGMSWLSSCLRWNSCARLAMISYSFGALCMCAAASVSGFFVPAFTAGYVNATAADAEIASNILRALREINRSCDLIGVVGMSIGIGFWSGAFAARPQARWVALLGVIVCLGGLWGVTNGFMGATVKGVITFVLAQSVWNIVIGIFLIRTPGPEKDA